MSFATLKKNRKANFEKLRENLSKNNNDSNNKDARFWDLTKNDKGVGTATMRFLPDKNEKYWTLIKKHSFQANGKWFINDCPKTIGKDCPVCEENSLLWDTKIKENEALGRLRKARKIYIANVYIVSDPGNPENEGQVKLFRFGQRIFDKIKAQMHPEYEDQDPKDPFDLWEGSDFKLRSKIKDDYANYDDSEFLESNSFKNKDDKELEALFNSTIALDEFTSEDKYKSYAELQEQYDKVVNGVKSNRAAKNDETIETPKSKAASTAAVGKTKKSKAEEEEVTTSVEDDDDDFLKEIEDLINDN